MLGVVTMFRIIICMLISVVSVGYSAECITQSPCQCIQSAGRTIDLSSVSLGPRPRFYEIETKDGASKGLYSYNPCLSFDSPSSKVTRQEGKNKPCEGAAACIRTPGGADGEAPEEHAIGLQSTALMGYVPKLWDQHVNYTVPGADQTLTVKLICNENATTHHLEVEEFENGTNKHIVMLLTSKCACPNMCSPQLEPDPSGLSTGSQLLIAFFTIAICYFVVGIVWNVCNGAQGVEAIPNLEFWNDLPKLIVEGVAFTCTCCSRKRSYGEV